MHTLSNCDTSCVHVRVFFVCTVGYPCLKNWWHEAMRGSWRHSCAHLFSAPAAASNPSCCEKGKRLVALLVTSAQRQYGFLRPQAKKWNNCFAWGCIFSLVTVAGRWLSSLTTADSRPVMTIPLCVLLGTLPARFLWWSWISGV